MIFGGKTHYFRKHPICSNAVRKKGGRTVSPYLEFGRDRFRETTCQSVCEPAGRAYGPYVQSLTRWVVSNIVHFHRYLEKIPIVTNFSDGLKPPTS